MDQNDKAGRTPLHWAAISGHAASAKILLDAGAPVLSVTRSKESPLHCACEAGRVAVVRVILQSAGDAKEELFALKNDAAKTACDLAVGAKCKAAVEALKQGGDKQVGSKSMHQCMY